MANPSPTKMRDQTESGGQGNGGIVAKSIRGGTMIQAYGNDRSTMIGSAEAERGGELAGGPNNLSHSLNGASANQGGKS